MQKLTAENRRLDGSLKKVSGENGELRRLNIEMDEEKEVLKGELHDLRHIQEQNGIKGAREVEKKEKLLGCLE